MKKCTLALGCFWKPEENFKNKDGIIETEVGYAGGKNPIITCLLYTSPSPRDKRQSRMPSSA